MTNASVKTYINGAPSTWPHSRAERGTGTLRFSTLPEGQSRQPSLELLCNALLLLAAVRITVNFPTRALLILFTDVAFCFLQAAFPYPFLPPLSPRSLRSIAHTRCYASEKLGQRGEPLGEHNLRVLYTTRTFSSYTLLLGDKEFNSRACTTGCLYCHLILGQCILLVIKRFRQISGNNHLDEPSHRASLQLLGIRNRICVGRRR